MKYLVNFNESLKRRIDILENTTQLREYVTTALVDLLDMGFVLSLQDKYDAVIIIMNLQDNVENLSGIKISDIINPIKSFIEYMINDYKMTDRILIKYEVDNIRDRDNIPYVESKLINIFDLINETFDDSILDIDNIYSIAFRVED